MKHVIARSYCDEAIQMSNHVSHVELKECKVFGDVNLVVKLELMSSGLWGMRIRSEYSALWRMMVGCDFAELLRIVIA